MKLIAILLGLSSMAMERVLAETTNDPLQHFRAEWDLEGVTKIYKLEVDINNDGLKEVFLSTGKSEPDESGDFGWQLYIARAGGQYEVAAQKTETGVNPGSVPAFKKDRYWIGLIPELNRYGLLHLQCGRGGQAKCQLKAIVIEGDTWKQIAIGQPVNSETNFQQLVQRFSNPPAPVVLELVP